MAILGIIILCGLGAAAYLALQDDEEVPMPTATPDEFQTDGGDFGAIEPFVPPPAPEPEVVVVEAPPPEPNAELLAQIEALQAQIEALQNAPEPVGRGGHGRGRSDRGPDGADRPNSKRRRRGRSRLPRRLGRARPCASSTSLDLDAAQLEAQNRPAAPLPTGPTEEELAERERQRLLAAEEAERQRRLRENEAARIAELERRRAEEAAFQQARIESPTIAFGGGGGNEGELAERTFGDVTDFVLNGALPTQVTQAEVIANPGNTVVQGTMIQAVTETALDSSLPGQIRAIISEDVHAYDGSRILIPRGSRLIGRYRSGLDIAQQRVTIAWDRIILPTNQTVTISSFGGDELGRSGVTGFVDTRFRERFGSAALISLITAAPGSAAGNVDDEDVADVLEDVGDDLSDATDSIIGEYLSIGPVIYVDQGSRITVMVDRDVEIF